MIRLTLCMITIFLLCSAEEDVTEELSFSPDWNTETSLAHIDSLENHCDGKICRDFYYPDVSEIAFFDIKQNIRIIDDDTYEVREQIVPDNLIFLNSTFAHFPLHLFYSLRNVSELDMRNCSIEAVTWENFLQANNLEILLLSQNKLRVLTESTFSYASQLQFLFLDENRIRTLVSDTFRGLSKLSYLNLSNNRLRELPGMLFSQLPLLSYINLAGNRLQYLPNEIFSRNPHLKQVVLTNNKLRQLDEYIFKNQPNLIFLDISHNTRLGRLILNVNTEFLMVENCSLYLVNLYGAITNVDLRDNQIVELYFSQPESLEKLVLRNNALQQISSLTKAVNLRELDIADNPKLEYLPDPWLVNSLERLDLSNITLGMLPISNLAEQTNLRWLNVSSNKLQEIPAQSLQYLRKLTHFDIAANDWNCYNLRLLMDLLIKPNGIVYKYDQFDADFPGEYIEGIACMYRMEDSDELMSESEKDAIKAIASQSEAIKQASMGDGNSFETTNEYPTDGTTEEQKLRTEIKTLRNELKAIVQFYESKFDVVFNKMEDLNQRLAAFERMNSTMFQHITIST